MSSNGRITWTTERRKLSDLQPWPRNPRQIRQAQAERLAESWNEFGQVETLAVGPDGEVYNGHQRINVLAQEHGEDYEVDVRVANRPLTEKEREKLTVYLHRGATGEFDFDMLANEFEVDELLAWGFDEWELGIDLSEPERAGEDTEPQVDRAEELCQEWGVESGQLWVLGDHRLICGDCTDADVVARVMDGEKADTLVSDPPYGVGWDYLSYDDNDIVANAELVERAWHFAPEAKVWTSGKVNLGKALMLAPDAKILCWYKKFSGSRNGLGGASTWEPILAVNIQGGTLPNDHIEIMTDREPGLRELHSCPKPIGLYEHLIQHLAGNIIYEPFSGSGTTIIACENLSRHCRAVEISPAYCAVALQRWTDHTGRQPKLIPQVPQ